MAYFQKDGPGNGVHAVPGEGLDVPIWLLGSSDFSARLAAEMGMPFAFASHFAPDYLHEALRVPEHKRFTNLAKVGNTVSASLPIALRDAELAGALRPGMRVLLVGFGVGLSWGVTVITWSPSRPA